MLSKSEVFCHHARQINIEKKLKGGYIGITTESALSSVVEHLLDVKRAGGSIPSARTR
ncbi:MAG: hypothetical protein RIQ56_769 [Candidatus Parcubacteria bacterium]